MPTKKLAKATVKKAHRIADAINDDEPRRGSKVKNAYAVGMAAAKKAARKRKAKKAATKAARKR